MVCASPAVRQYHWWACQQPGSSGGWCQEMQRPQDVQWFVVFFCHRWSPRTEHCLDVCPERVKSWSCVAGLYVCSESIPLLDQKKIIIINTFFLPSLFWHNQRLLGCYKCVFSSWGRYLKTPCSWLQIITEFLESLTWGPRAEEFSKLWPLGQIWTSVGLCK